MRPCFLFALSVLVTPLAVRAQTFTNVSDLLPSTPTGSTGATVADVDGDGRLDLARSTELLLQREAGFSSVPFEGGTPLGAVFGDVDREGRLEAFILYAFDPAILRYDPAREALAPLTGSLGEGAGLALTQGSILLDYDRDGALDVLIGNDGGIDILYRGAGDGTFVNVSDETLPQIARGDYGMMAADYDRDGDDDVYVGLCIGETENLLYLNDGTAFSEVAASAGVDDARASWGVFWFDFDNDGWLDLFVTNMPGPNSGNGANKLFRNNADGTFTDVAAEAGVAGLATEWSWSATASDFDNDGWLDLFVVNRPETSRLYRNNADGTFSDITNAAGLSALTGLPVASGDMNGDGWLDFYMPAFGPDNQDVLFFNDGGTNGWLSVDLTGVASNPDGIGARVEVSAGDLSMIREITAGDGFMSQSHGLRAHFGLGMAASADVTVHWPSGQVDVIEGITANQEVTVVEGVGVNAPPPMFGLTAPADGEVVPLGEPVTLQWEAAADADAVSYTVHLAAPDGTDATFETAEPTLELSASALTAEGAYHWAVVARDAYSARTSLDNASFTNNPNVANEAVPAVSVLRMEVWPNPARASVSVRFELSAPDAVRLEVVDLLGRRVQRVALGERTAGSHIEALEMSGLRAGTYIVRLEGERSGSVSAAITYIE